LAVLLLVLLALLSLGFVGDGKRDLGHLVSVDFSQAAGDKKTKAVKTVATAHTKAQTKAVTPPEAVPQTAPTQAPTQLIHLSHEEFAASDISAIAKRHSQQADAEAASQRNGTFGPGGGPGGARLYAAQWYREPRDAELAPFLASASRPEGAWAEVACQTIANFHVENCQELDEYPLGSGLARGLRRAAWQFLVWPPRVDGKPEIGKWVRIRFDFSRNAKKDSD